MSTDSIRDIEESEDSEGDEKSLLLPNGEELPPALPGPGIPASDKVRSYAKRLRARIAQDPKQVPSELHVWLAQYGHTQPGTRGQRRMLLEESFEGDGNGAATERERGLRLDKLMIAQAALQDSHTKREEAQNRASTAAFTAAAKASEAVNKALLEGYQQALGSQAALTAAMAGQASVVTASAAMHKELLDDHLSLVRMLKAANGTETGPDKITNQLLGLATQFAPQILPHVGPSLEAASNWLIRKLGGTVPPPLHLEETPPLRGLARIDAMQPPEPAQPAAGQMRRGRVPALNKSLPERSSAKRVELRPNIRAKDIE